MPYQIEAQILANRQVGPRHFRLTLHAPRIVQEAAPGQFVQLLYSSAYGPIMRRPFSVHDIDTAPGAFDIIYLVRGPFTEGLSELLAGGWVSVVGPLGNAFTPDSGAEGVHMLVAGGVGAPPLHFLASRLLQGLPAERVLVINGARSEALLVACDDFAALGLEPTVCTDDGTAGLRGSVLDALRVVSGTRTVACVYACGPEPMLRAVGEHCLAAGIPCRLSVETVMMCGIGVCMGCVVKLRSNEAAEGFTYARACHDGPVFEAEDILWE
jgi:dihydroorotate dehydrogenase electron transfer subunit